MIARVKQNTIITASGMIFFQVSNFGLGVYITRFLGAIELANYQLFVTTATFLSLFAKIGFDEKLSYQLPTIGGPRTRQGQELTIQIVSQTTLASIVLVAPYTLYVLCSCGFRVDLGVWVEILSFALYLPAFVAVLMMVSVLRADQQMFRRTFFGHILPNLLCFSFLMVLGIWLTTNLTLLARACSFMLIAVWLLLFIKSKYGFVVLQTTKFVRPTEPSWLVIGIVGFAIESGLLTIKYSELFLSDLEFGAFAVLLRLGSLVMLCPTALVIVMGPILAKDPNNRRVQRNLLLVNSLGVITTLVAIAVLGKYLLACFGPQYSIYAGQLVMLSTALAALAVTQPIASIFIATGARQLIYYPGLLVIIGFVAVCFGIQERTLDSTLHLFESTILAYAISRVLLYLIVFVKR